MVTKNEFEIVVALATVAILSACTSSPRSSESSPGAFVRFSPCPQPAPEIFSQGEVVCGTLNVPENRSQSHSRMLSLRLSILKADEKASTAEPILVLTGGPGGSAHQYVGLGFMPLEKLRAHHDIVVLEQRGTGYTTAPLVCEGVETYPLTRIEAPALTRCRDELRAAGVDFRGYDTAANAQDFADLRRLLKIKNWTFLANSYGTRLALALMHDHPEGIRAAVLDAAYPLYMNVFFTAGQLQGFSHIVTACAHDAKCSTAHPRLRDNFIALVERLDRNPVAIRDQSFGGELVLAILAGSLGSRDSVRKIPVAIDHGAAGDLEPLLALGSITRPAFPPLPPGFDNRLFLAFGMYALVECRDSYYQAPPLDAPEAPTGGLAGWPASVVAANARLMAHKRIACEIFDPGPSATPMAAHVKSAVPTLVLNGQFDGGTSSEMGDLVASELQNATRITTRGAGHSSLLQPCIEGIVRAFIEQPTTAPDLTCTNAITPLTFD